MDRHGMLVQIPLEARRYHHDERYCKGALSELVASLTHAMRDPWQVEIRQRAPETQELHLQCCNSKIGSKEKTFETVLVL